MTEPVAVHILSVAPEARSRAPQVAKSCERNSTMTTQVLAANTPSMILGQSPRRRRAVLTIVGQSTDVAYLCTSKGDAQQCARLATVGQAPGTIVMGLQVIELTSSDEVWVTSATVPAIGVIAEFEAN